MELLWRLFVAGVVIVGPTVLFLGLWHGLMRLRNGELVRRVCARMDETPADVAVGAPALKKHAKSRAPERQAERFAPKRKPKRLDPKRQPKRPATERQGKHQAPERQAEGHSPSRPSSIATSQTMVGLLQCSRCGLENVTGYDYCRECQSALEDD